MAYFPELGTGLSKTGVYTANGSSNFIQTAVSLQDADNKLDAAIATKQNTLTLGNITGTNVTISGGTGAVIGSGVSISLAQSIALTATPTFAGLTLTGLSGVVKAASGVLTGSASLNDLAQPTTSFSMNNQNLTNLAIPVNPNDAATKNYVDSAVQGLSPKSSVLCATVGALPTNTYANGTSGVGATLTATANAALVIDGITVTAGARVLIQNEATPANNGIYVVTQVGDATHPYILTRSLDNNTSAEILGSYVFAESGTVNANLGFVNSNSPSTAITMGTTAITFVQFTGAADITVSSPLLKSGNALSIQQAGSTQAGYLSSTDWINFNSKQAAGNYITALTGDVVASGPGSASSTIQAGAITLAKMANLSANSIIGNNTGSSATPIALSNTQVKALLAIAQADVAGLTTSSSPSFVAITSTVATGTAPLTVTSTTQVANLNASLLAGASLSTDGTFSANSDTLIPSQKAIKTYVSSASNARNVNSISSAYTATTSDAVILGSGTFTITLPTASTFTNKSLVIKNIGTGVLSIASGSATVDGTASPFTISNQYASIELVTDNVNWYII